jgi:hypothetical protein
VGVEYGSGRGGHENMSGKSFGKAGLFCFLPDTMVLSSTFLAIKYSQGLFFKIK